MIRCRRYVAWMLATSLWFTCAAMAAVCPDTGDAPPSVVTLMRSKTDSARGMWIVKPDCSLEEHTLPSDQAVNTKSFDSIEYIASLPTDATALYVSNQRLSRGADLSNEKIKRLELDGISVAAYASVVYPKAVETLKLTNIPFTSTSQVRVPSTVFTLAVTGSGLTSFNIALPALYTLSLGNNRLTSIDFKIPPGLISLYLDGNPIKSIDALVLPATLKWFSCQNCGLTSVRGIKWPSALSDLYLGGNQITNFEIRSSDVLQFKKADLEVNSMTKCADATATLTTVRSTKVCVISDARFAELYGDGATTTTSGSKEKDGSGILITNTSSSGSKDGSTRSPRKRVSSGSASGETSDDAPIDSASGSQSSTGSKASNRKRPTSTLPGGTQSSSTHSQSSTAVWVIVGGGVVVVAIAVVWYQRSRRRSTQGSKEASQYSTAATPSTSKTSGTQATSGTEKSNATTGSSGALPNDIRDDEAFNAMHRIPKTSVKIGSMIARGGFGVVYNGVYNDREVAIKQMIPDAWRDDSKLKIFMDEVRMCASLDHPKIVQFIGITWTSHRDVSVVTEFMEGGDLYSLLHKQSEVTAARDWIERWTSDQIKSKASIAVDVVEALVYLHSLSNPILHRDLKARNVLLDREGNAKLSDFGISRELSMDETMTGEVGTVAWIAPEVLRGKRYSESADIYSLGVLLIELDTCRHPYNRETSASSDTHSLMGSAARQNMHIAMLVSSGEVRPTVSPTCPSAVRELVDRCVEFEAAKRPSATEVREQLQNMLLTSAKV